MQQPAIPHGPHLVLYDGACGLCHGVVRFVLSRDGRGLFHFAALQSAAATRMLARSGRRSDDLTTFVVLPDYRDSAAGALTKGRAALFVAARLGWPWKALGLLGLLPAAMLDRLYDIVAAGRYRLFGRREQCVMPSPGLRSRFIDVDDEGARVDGAAR